MGSITEMERVHQRNKMEHVTQDSHELNKNSIPVKKEKNSSDTFSKLNNQAKSYKNNSTE
jgi:hypothetical protein